MFRQLAKHLAPFMIACGGIYLGSGAQPSGAAPPADPTNLPGNLNLSIWLRADKGVALGTTMLRTSGTLETGGVVTLSGSLNKALPIYVIIVTNSSTLGNSHMSVSLTGGATFIAEDVPTAAVYVGGGLAALGIAINMTAATYKIGAVYQATVASWTDQKSGFVWSQATATKQPRLDYSRCGGQLSLKFDGIDDILLCATAGVAAFVNGDDVPFSLFFDIRNSTAGQGGFFGVGSSTTTQCLIIGATPGSPWVISKRGNDASLKQGTATLSAATDTTYRGEFWHTGTVVAGNINGVALTIASGGAQNAAPCPALDTVSIGAWYINGAESTYASDYISELVIYTGNQHATTSAPIGAYQAARYVDLVSTILADSNFFDGVAYVAGADPITLVPNDYNVDALHGGFRRLVATNTVGCTAIDVTAIRFLNSAVTAVDGYATVSVWIDGVYSQTLTYGPTIGLKYTQRIVLDGGAHTVEIEEAAAIVGVSFVGGAPTITPAAATSIGVLGWGDSILYGFGSSVLAKGFMLQLRHALSAADPNYQTTIWGVPGKVLATDSSTAPKVAATTAAILARLPNVTKRILIAQPGVNDYQQNTPAATYGTQYANQVASLHAADPGLKIICVSMIPKLVETANSAGSTLEDFRNAGPRAVVAANPSFCILYEGLALGIDPVADLVDGLHPNDGGYLKYLNPLITLVRSL